MDFLAGNRLGYALYSEMFTDPVRPANNARFVFLNPRSMEFFVDWERAVVGVSAAIANAVYHATGRRIRSLPITVEQLL